VAALIVANEFLVDEPPQRVAQHSQVIREIEVSLHAAKLAGV
jgi:hypothetical protein